MKRKKHVENHHDDCGEDLGSIWLDEDELNANFTESFLLNPDHLHFLLDQEARYALLEDGLLDFMFNVHSSRGIPLKPHTYLLAFRHDDLAELFLAADARGKGLDLTEICGGVAHYEKKIKEFIKKESVDN